MSGLIDAVDDPVGVVLHRSRENDDFVQLSHLFQKLEAARSNPEFAFATRFIVMY